MVGWGCGVFVSIPRKINAVYNPDTQDRSASVKLSQNALGGDQIFRFCTGGKMYSQANFRHHNEGEAVNHEESSGENDKHIYSQNGCQK